jgi:hypothetical protein
LPHIEPLHYGFKFQASDEKGYCVCSLAKCLTLWRKQYHVVNDHSGCGVRLFQGSGLLQHCRGKGDENHTATAFYLTRLFLKRMGLTQACGYHEENDQSRKTVDTNKQISDCYYQSVDSQESDHVNQVNENIEDKACDTVGDLAVCDDVEKNDAFTSIEQVFQGGIIVPDFNTCSDEQVNAENQAKDVQAESTFADSSEVKYTSTLSGQELPGQRIHDNEGVNSVGTATDGNGDPNKDSDYTMNAENMTVDEPDCTLDSVEVNTVGETNDTYGHPSQESNVTVNAENSNVDEPANGDPSKDPDHTIDEEITTVDELDCTLDSVKVKQLVRKMMLMVILVKNLMLQLMQKTATLMSHIFFMTFQKQLTQMLSRQNQWLMMMNYQFNALKIVRDSIELIRQLM